MRIARLKHDSNCIMWTHDLYFIVQSRLFDFNQRAWSYLCIHIIIKGRYICIAILL